MDMPDYRYYGNDDYRRYERPEWRDGGARGDGLLAAALKGAAAGVVGTAVLSLGMHYGPPLLRKAGLMQPPPQGGGEEPTEKLAVTVADTVADAQLDDATKHAAGRAIHWGYGALWGAVYGAAEHELRWPTPLAGIAFGGLVGTVASTVVPAMRLAPPPTEQPVEQTAMMSALHLLYGEATALAYQALE